MTKPTSVLIVGENAAGECRGVDIHMNFFVCRFDLSQANLNDANLDKLNPADIPDVVSL